MCPSERYTHKRGRSGVPSTLVRTRSWTRWRCKSLDSLRTRAVATVCSPAISLGRAAGLRTGLAGLLLQPLAGDANALLLIRIGRAQRTHVRGNLADLSLVRAADNEVRLLLHRHLDAFRNRKLDGMRLSERESNHFALQLRAIADADDIQLFLETGGDAMNGVGHQRARESMQSAVLFGGALGGQHSVLLFERDPQWNREGKFAFRPLHVDLAALQGDFHAGRHWNWFISDT